jgi:hypothetical protein
MKYTADLLHTLDAYHQGGLWHKDVKPDNIIIHDDTAHLVDLGLVTPLRSAMTLTTHGTEYFRDPEMVRMALKGVKVHQVDGARFDIYAVGAVMYSVIENSFPAHGGLSQISRRCPDALRWIVRRAMTDYDKRYLRASDMLADLEVVRSAPDPFAVRLADLPSVRGGAAEPAPAPDHFAQHGAPFTPLTAPAVAQAASAHAARSPHNAQPEPASTDPAANAPSNPAGEAASQGGTTRHRPRIVITDWFKGQYAVTGGDDVPVAAARQSNTGFGPGGFRPGASGPRAAAAVAMATAADAMNRAAQHFGAANPHANRRANPHAQPQPVPEAGAADFGPPAPGQARRTPRVRAIPDPSRRSAADQVRSARERAAAARHRAQTRMAGRYAPFRNTDANAGAGKGASAAIFGFIGVCVLFAGGIVTAALMRGTGDANLASAPDGARVVVSDPSFPTPPSVPDLTNGFAVPAIADGSSHSVQTRIDSAIRQATDRIVEIQEVFREAGELASVAAQSPGGTVIVVTDVLPPMTRDARASIDGAMARLMAFGFTLVGSVQGVDVEGEDLDRQIELIAQVRSARGQVPLGTPDADRILQGYLAAHPDAGDAIVWITPGEDRDEPTFYLVLPANPDGESTRAMRLRNTLQTALSAPPGQKS